MCSRWRCLSAITALFLVGCTVPLPIVSPLTSPSILPVLTLAVTETAYPTATATVTPQPSPTPSPLPSPTATWPPYSGNPFTVVFLRNGNLWLSTIGGGGERQLTAESPDWPIGWFDVSPQCDRIAYIPHQGPPSIDALVKQVRISDGSVSILTGHNDPYSECNVEWLDNTHIVFQLQEFLVAGHEKDNAWQDVQPFHHIVFDLATAKRTFIPESLLLSQSPDGRYWLTCSRGYVYQGPCTYKLRDLASGKQWQVAPSVGWGDFIAWSPDGQEMLFDSYRDPLDATVQLVVINVAENKERVITPDDKTVTSAMSASWSPDGKTIAYTQCDADSNGMRVNCALWLVNRDGSHARMIPAKIAGEAMNLAWTPDGSRLVFTIFDTPIIWSVRTNGTDLRPIVSDLRTILSDPGQYQILCKTE